MGDKLHSGPKLLMKNALLLVEAKYFATIPPLTTVNSMAPKNDPKKC